MSPKRLTPAEQRASARWEPDYQYECSHGHVIVPNGPITTCPVYRKGEPCDGSLERFGKGSGRKPPAAKGKKPEAALAAKKAAAKKKKAGVKVVRRSTGGGASSPQRGR